MALGIREMPARVERHSQGRARTRTILSVEVQTDSIPGREFDVAYVSHLYCVVEQSHEEEENIIGSRVVEQVGARLHSDPRNASLHEIAI